MRDEMHAGLGILAGGNEPVISVALPGLGKCEGRRSGCPWPHGFGEPGFIDEPAPNFRRPRGSHSFTGPAEIFPDALAIGSKVDSRADIHTAPVAPLCAFPYLHTGVTCGLSDIHLATVSRQRRLFCDRHAM